MINTFFIAAAPFVSLFQDATGDLRIATPSLDDKRIIRSIGIAARNGASPLVLLVPKVTPIYLDGKPLIGRDPFAESESELKALQDAHAQIFINPQFTNIGAKTITPEVNAGMSYAVVTARNGTVTRSIVCTGPIGGGNSHGVKDVCVQSDSVLTAAALTALHRADFDDLQPAAERSDFVAQAKKHLIVSPANPGDLISYFQGQQNVRIATCSLEADGELLSRILAMGEKVKIVLPAGYAISAAQSSALASKKVTVEISQTKFNGSMITSGAKTFVGSQCLTLRHFGSMRQVGIVFDSAVNGTPVLLGESK